MHRILTIEDDETTAQEIAAALLERGFCVERIGDGHEGLRLASANAYDAITLDRLLPGLDGLEIASTLKARGVETPILMISAMIDVDERVRGLRAGGDDYLTKPFVVEEMIARIEVMIRRASSSRKTMLCAAGLELDLINHVARRGGRDLQLLPKEFKLLEMFVRHAGQVLTREILFEQIWGYRFNPGTNVIEVHINQLRKKIEEPGSPKVLKTVRRSGYILSEN